MYRHIALSLLASCSLWTRHSRGLSVNRTIDDELGDVVTGAKPQYSPDGVWNQGTRCSSCHIGTSQVDVSQTFDGTWHDGTYFVGQPDIEVRATFIGTAVYVYFIVPGSLPSIFTFMNTTFFIDDEPVGQFTHPPDAAADISYRVPVYTNNTLANSEHTLLMRATGTNTSLILFDYIVYTAEADSTSSSSSASLSPSATATDSPSPTSPPARAPVSAIAGGTVGGVIVLAAIAAVALFLLRRRRPRPSRPRSILTVGDSEIRSDDELLSGESGYSLGPTSPSFLPVPATIPHGTSEEKSNHKPRSYESPRRESAGITTTLSVTAAAQERAELLQRIRALEDQVGGIQSRPARQPSGDVGHVASEATIRGLQDEIAALRGALTGLRTELADDRRIVAEPLPRYEVGTH